MREDSHGQVIPDLILSADIMSIKEDRPEVTLGILIKIPHKIHLDLSPIRLARLKTLSKFIFLCL